MPWRQRDELGPEVPPWDPAGLAAMPRDRPLLASVAAAVLAAGLVIGALWFFGWLRAPGPASIDDAMPFIDQGAFNAATGAAADSAAGVADGDGTRDDPDASRSDDTARGGDASRLIGDPSTGEPATGDTDGAAGDDDLPAAIVVHVAGAVKRPGLVTLDANTRVQDAIDAAGGASATADIERLNLATILVDGQRLYVPAVGEDDTDGPDVVAPTGPVNAEPQSGAADSTSGAPALIDVNTASAAELETVPGIGPVTAEKIIAKREAIGGYDTIDDLLEVSGIGDARLASMRDYLRVGSS